MDVHSDNVVACLMLKRKKPIIRSFGTMTSDLISLREWLAAEQITHVAMESTGVYWKPVYNILEGTVDITLGNARDIKNMPGRKTDPEDAHWIATLLRHGLIRPSFIAPREIRDLRDLTRYRRKLVQNVSSERCRVQKILEDANIKLTEVVSDLFGVTGQGLLNAILDGEVITPKDLDRLVKGKLRPKIPVLAEAINGNLREHHRFMLRGFLSRLDSLAQQIAAVERRIADLVRPYEKQLELLDTIPGVDRIVAFEILAEVGADMSVFPSERHISSWAGVSPGNESSNKKQKKNKTVDGNVYLKSILCEAAWAASKTRNTYLSQKYYQIRARKGGKKALMVVAHKILISAYHILLDLEPYKELGSDYLRERFRKQTERRYVHELETAGYVVIRPPQAPGAANDLNSEPAAT
jgi:transposase